jgi:hypothetical protein
MRLLILRRGSTVRAGALCLAAGVLLTGCGEATTSGSGEPAPSATRRPAMATGVPAADGQVRARWATVLDDGDGPELCLGGVAESLPPQCGGPPIDGWDWTDHEGSYEQASGVRWGEFSLVGTFDGERFAVDSVGPPDQSGEPEPLLGTPCPEPAGGWQVVDPEKVSVEAQEQAIQVAGRLPGYSMAWVDQSINPAINPDGSLDEGEESGANDPALLILNVSVTEDVEGAEATLRETWGGSLCVSEARTTEADRLRIQEEISRLPGMLTSGAGSGDVVELTVTHDDGSLQAWADATYGEGVVEVRSALTPVE